MNKTKYEENVLLIFVGYADDAQDEANCICELKEDLQLHLNHLNRMATSILYSKVEIFEWKEHAKLGVGGQDYAITPNLERANIGVFIFRARVGKVTWDELKKFRGNIKPGNTVLALFPAKVPIDVDMMAIENIDKWRDLLEKKKSLTADWSEANSQSITPVEPYENTSHLKEIVLKKLKDVFPEILNIQKPLPILPIPPLSSSIIEDRPFVDRATSQTEFDQSLVAWFRGKLRDEARIKSKGKSDNVLLVDNGYLANGKLTIAGVLLFGRPKTELSSATIQCVVYKGTTNTADKVKYLDFDESLFKQIEDTYDFVAAHTEKRERPIGMSLRAETIYKFPMSCVREMIANALCHRDYSDRFRQSYVRIYTDRIEILNPGKWFTGDLPLNTEIKLGQLKSESVPRNMSIAHAFASVKFVEKEGSGINASLRDCNLSNAPEPTVLENDGFVVVRVFPRRDWDDISVLKAHNEKSLRGKTAQEGKVALFYSHKDETWKDRLVSHMDVLQAQGFLEIWDDRQITVGNDWFPEIDQALKTAHVAILLISANLLTSKFVLDREVSRLIERRQSEGMRVIPLIVKPCAWQKVAWLKPIQAHPQDGRPLSGGNEHQIDTDLAALATELADRLQPMPHAPSPTRFIPLPAEKIFSAKLPTSTSKLFGREDDLKRLDAAWADPATHILTLVAWGGVGKTALVNEWLARIAKENYRSAERVYAWSFYSQGTREDRQVSGDEFIAHGLKWFGDPDPNAGAPWDKGARLAALIRQQKTLLVLDGLEPLQYPPGPLHGQLKDQGVQALLKQLAGDNNGLCLVTTRVHVVDLAHKTKSSVQAVDLENLSAEAGAQLLKSLGVIGREAELRAASNEYDGHALALNLLGSYLATVHEGEVRKRDLIPHLIAQEAQPGYHAYRVMVSYEHWLAATPELEILFLMGLFDRPAAKGAIDALLAPPPIAGLTSNLQNLSFDKWQFTLKRLRELRLLAEKDKDRPDTLECHPLAREYFGDKLREQNPTAWKAAHSRIYEYYKKLPAKELPDTLEEMEPLFLAVAHGSMASRHQEVFDEIYWKRIRRRDEAYNIKNLGAFSADLLALSNFFKILWNQPTSLLNDDYIAIVLSWAGFDLRALGRLGEAVQPMQQGLGVLIQQKDWKQAAGAAGNLSELYLTLGDIRQAIVSARQSADFADRVEDAFLREAMRTTYADALHYAGESVEAHKFFHEAESIHKQRQPDDPYLNSLWGFRFCDLLLNNGEYQEVQKRASQTIEIAKRNRWLLDIALDKLSLGRAFLLLARSEVKGQAQSFKQARDFLQQAVADLRESGRQDHLPRGLLARAAFYRAQNEFALASADLEEAREIAERGEMKLFLADYYLEASKLQMASGKKEKAKEHLAIAKGMIEQMGYGRRKPEVEELEKQIKSI